MKEHHPRRLLLPLPLLLFAAALTPLGAAAAHPRNVIDDMIIAALENLRDGMVTGWPELGVPPLDPLRLGAVDIDIESGGTKVHGNLTEVTMNGMSTFNIDLVDSSLLFLEVDVTLGIPILDLSGNYSFLGEIVGLFPLFGDGAFWLDALNFSLSLHVKLGETENGLFGVKTLDLDTFCNDTEVYFEDIMGGGDMADFVNDVLSSLGPDFLQAIEDAYLPWLEEALRHEINLILQAGKRPRDDSVNDYFDLVFANMRQSIIENGQDPLGLPADSDNFTVSLFNSTMNGGLAVGPGLLKGLSSIHRAGDMILLYVGEQDEVIVGGEVGLIDLQADYTFGLSLALFGKELDFSIKLSFVKISFETDVFLDEADIVFAHCNITELGPLHFKETGTGPLDTPLYNLLVNTLLGSLHGLVTTAVEGVVCSLLEGIFTSSG